jgi:hypothetical protein
VLNKKIWANFKRIIELFTKKNCQKALKNVLLGSRIRDPGSGKNLFRIRIPDPGVKKAPDPGSGSATLEKGDDITPFGGIPGDSFKRLTKKCLLTFSCTTFLPTLVC